VNNMERAARVHKDGPPLEIEPIDIPSPAPGEARRSGTRQ
jgi:hypothetical protein